MEMRSQGRSPVGSRRRRARIFSYRRRIVLPILILIGAQVFLPPPPRASGSKRAKESSAGSAAASLEEGPGFEVRQVEIRTAAATLTLRNGVIYPAPSAAGVSPEMVFVGQGHIHIDPPDAIEAGQLRLFTHTDLLDRSFHEAVLVVTDEAARNSLLAKRMGGEWNAARRGRAERLWDLWRRGGERRALGIEAALFRANLGEAGRPPFLAAHLVSQDLGSFFLLEDPEEDEQIKVGRFFPITLNDDSRKKAQRELEHIQRKGFLGAFQLEDLGSVDTWMSFPLQDASGRPVHGRAGFKPLRYQMDIRIDKKDQHLSGKVEIDLAAREAGRRTALLTLDPDYTVQRITCGDSGSLTFRQDHELIMVVLPRALKKREKIALRVEYQGRSLVRRKKGAFVLLDTAAWYPRAGQVDRALYDVTFHWPWWLQLVASGRRVDGGREKGGMGWRRYRLDFPAVDFGFGLGKYEFSSAQAGHVKVRFAYDKGGQKLPAEDRRTIEKTVVEALGFYEETFGPYPLNDLQVVTWAHNFSQGFLGYVSLSNSMMDDRNR
ncbi:MAG: hypothetical protein ACE5ID_08375, partial [Acidobacteriota bacterium]